MAAMNMLEIMKQRQSGMANNPYSFAASAQRPGSMLSLMNNPASQIGLNQSMSQLDLIKQKLEENKRQQNIQSEIAQMPSQPIQPGYNQFGQQQQLPSWAQQQFAPQMPDMQQFGMPYGQQSPFMPQMTQQTIQEPAVIGENMQQPVNPFASNLVGGTAINQAQNQFAMPTRTFIAPQFTMGNMGGYFF